MKRKLKIDLKKSPEHHENAKRSKILHDGNVLDQVRRTANLSAMTKADRQVPKHSEAPRPLRSSSVKEVERMPNIVINRNFFKNMRQTDSVYTKGSSSYKLWDSDEWISTPADDDVSIDNSVSSHLQSQENVSYSAIDYLRSRPKEKDEGEEQNYLRDPDVSSSEDENLQLRVPSQSSTPTCSFDFVESMTIRDTTKSKKKKNGSKTRREVAPDTKQRTRILVDYAVTSSSDSSDGGSAQMRPPLPTTCPNNSIFRRSPVPFCPCNFPSPGPVACCISPFQSASGTSSERKTVYKRQQPNETSEKNDTFAAQKQKCGGGYKQPAFAHLSPYSRTNQSYRSAPETFSPRIVDVSPGFTDSPSFDTSLRAPLQRRRPFLSLPEYDTDDSVSDGVGFIDSHCHLDFLFKRQDFKGTYKQYRIFNQDTFPTTYQGCVAVFCDPQTFNKSTVWQGILNEAGVWGAFGCHPHMARDYNEEVECHLLKAITNHKVVALGEIGLDYSYKNTCDRDIQKSVFRKQLRIAVERKMPLVIHSRDATEDTLVIMKEMVPVNHVIHRHCFTGDWTEAKQWLNEFPNLYIGLTALVTFQSARHVHDVARNIPLGRLLLETDTPYFLPRNVAKEKRWSHPGMAIHVAAQIAALRCFDSLEDVLKATRENTKTVYKI